MIKNKGYENRFFTNDTYKLASTSYTEDDRYFETNFNYNNYNENKKNVLIVGNSHGDDLLKVLHYSSLSNNYYFNIVSPKKRNKNLNYQVRYFYDFLFNNKAHIDGYNINFIDHLKMQYSKSKIIILATRWSEEDIKLLPKIIKKLNKDNKKIIIFSNALESKTDLNYYGFNRLDNWIFENKIFPSKNQIIDIEKKMFKDLQNKRKINTKLRTISNSYDVNFIERENIFCKVNDNVCEVLTPNGYKIYYDYAHLTIEGAKYFSNVIQNNKKFLEYLD